jgi:hypothetical protein
LELPAPVSEIGEKKLLAPGLSNTGNQGETTISAPSGGAEASPLPSATQVAVSEIPKTQDFPSAQTTVNEAKGRDSNEEEENSGLLQGFDDAGIVNIPFDEALALWKQLEPRFKDEDIGDILAEYLGMDNIEPNLAQVSQLEAWLKHFITIYDIKQAISMLQIDIGTRESRMKGAAVSYPEVVYEEREKILAIGLDRSTGLEGNILLNEYNEYSPNSAPMLVYRWTSFISMHAKESGQKICVEDRCGDLIPRLFAGQEWERYR